jgi:hypothetical protein
MAAVLVLGVSSAGAATLNFSALLTGPSENPPNISIGIGTAVVTWDTTAQTMRVQVTFTGLSGNTTASHIHCCVGPPGIAGVATTVPSFTGFPLGVTTGTYDHTFDMTDASSYNPGFMAVNGGTPASAGAALLAGIQAGQAYLNIHTTVYPGGEIRGFLQGVTAAQVTRFTAARTGKHVRLRWRTGSDSGTLGFYVARGSASHRTRATPRLIPAAGHVGGAGYSWLDRKPGRASRYWLQTVSLNGSKHWYGPVRVH